MAVIFSQILNMSMTGSVVILLVMLARLILKRAPKIFSYALWSVVLFRLLCPVAFTAPVSVLRMVGPAVQEAGNNISVVSYIPASIDTQADFIAVQPENLPANQVEGSEPKEQLRMTPMHAVALIWVAGTVGMILYSVAQYLMLRRKLVGSMQLQDNIYLTDYIDTAFVVGVLQPRIFLPSNVPSKERCYILAHEQHHIRRCDHIIKLLAYLALCIHWFNPLVWIAFVLAGKDMEMSCDEAVIRKLGAEIRADYSASLLRLATHKKILSGMPLAFGEGDTKGRVLNMAKWKKPTKWFVAICAILCICVVAICAVNPDDQVSSESHLDECRKVLELVQTSDGYDIITERENHGSFALNPTSTIHDYRHKDNWLQIHTVPDGNGTSLFAYLHVDDKYYEGMPLVENGTSGDLQWKESTYQGNVQPWIATFQWEKSTVTLDSVEDTGRGTIVHLNITDPFTLGEWTTEKYAVDCIFDAKGEFLAARQIVEFSEEYGITSTMRIVSLDENLIKMQIGLTYDDIDLLSEPEETMKVENTAITSVYGMCIVSDTYEDLTQEEITSYLRDAFDLDALLSHRVYQHNNVFQIDLQFADEVDELQLSSAKKFLINMFYNHELVKHNLGDYDLRLIDHIGNESEQLEFRIFVGDRLRIKGTCPAHNPRTLQIGNLPDGYSLSTDENHNVIFSKDTKVAGGIYELQYPNFVRNSAKNNTWDWVTALNVPENVPEDRFLLSIEVFYNTPYSLYASYGKNGVEERVHYFFESDEVVYDLWFDMSVASAAEKQLILDAAKMIEQKPEES